MYYKWHYDKYFKTQTINLTWDNNTTVLPTSQTTKTQPFQGQLISPCNYNSPPVPPQYFHHHTHRIILDKVFQTLMVRIQSKLILKYNFQQPLWQDNQLYKLYHILELNAHKNNIYNLV